MCGNADCRTSALNSAAVNRLPLSVTTCGCAPVRSSASCITSGTSPAVIVRNNSQCTMYQLYPSITLTGKYHWSAIRQYIRSVCHRWCGRVGVAGTAPTDALRLIDVGTGTTVNLVVPEVSPRWFPSGNELAYLAVGPSRGYLNDNRIMRGQGQLAIMNADGTNRRLIPTGVKLWNPHFEVSRDGKYLLAVSRTDTLEVIEVATGTTIALAFARRLHVPN